MKCLQAEFDRDLLRDALEKFGVHDISCHHTGKPLTATMRERGERWPCTCGLSAILKELEK